MDQRRFLSASLGVMACSVWLGLASGCGNAQSQSLAHANFLQTSLDITEGQGKISVTVRLDAPTKTALRLPLKFNGTADLERDFNAPAAVEFAANTQEARLDIEVLADGESECGESATLELVNSDGAQRRLTLNIMDHDHAARRLRVGPAPRAYLTPSAASLDAQPGDVIEIAAGEYGGDVAVWQASDIVLCGEDSGAQIKANGKAAEGKGIWVIKGDRVRVENVHFSGAKVSDKNGAGIRAEGKDLTVRHCSFTENENGILAGEQRDSTITIERSRFVKNGAGDGRSHNIYIGKIKRLNIRFTTLREAVVGHNVKSRAEETVLEYNRIMDGKEGTASYQVDLPNGGFGFLMGNVIQQGPEAENSTLIAYGAEGLQHPLNELYLVNNTVVNDRSNGIFVESPKGVSCALINNLFSGKGALHCSNGMQAANLDAHSDFIDRSRYEYRLVRGSKAIDGGVEPEMVRGFSMQPKYEYDADGAVRRRAMRGIPDIGAYEFESR